ncbi:MAG: SMI1/KNR4 family protein [Saprospiraceae bacterium]
MTLKYHQAIFDLLEVEPIIDSNRLAEITAIEEAYDIKLPEAIKEYFLIANMLDTLFQFSVFLEVNPLYLFGQTDSFDGLNDKNLELLKSRKIIPLFCERGRDWTWFLNLKNQDADPKILLHTQLFPDMLISHPHKFSKQLLLSVWDALVMQPQLSGFYVQGEHKSPDTKTLLLLRSNMQEISTSFILVSNETTYRFQRQNSFIAIVDNGQTATWYFYADFLPNLEKLLSFIKKVKGLIPVLKPMAWKKVANEHNKKTMVIERILSEYS